jgi:hypothetical protein
MYCGGHPASCSTGIGFFTVHFHLLPKLGMSGALPPLILVCIHGVDRNNSAVFIYLTFHFLNLHAMSKVKSRGCEYANGIKTITFLVNGFLVSAEYLSTAETEIFENISPSVILSIESLFVYHLES